MKKTLQKKRLFVTLLTALLVLVTVPLMAVFADHAVKNDVSASEMQNEVEPKRNNDEPIMDDPWFSVDYNVGYEEPDNELTQLVSFNIQDENITFIVPSYSDPNNTFLYWRDTQTGRIYHPGDTLTIKVSDIKYTEEEYYADEEMQELHKYWLTSPWILRAIWESDTITVDREGALQLMMLETDPDNFWNGDGINFYTPFKDVVMRIRGTYNMRTDSFTLEPGCDTIRIPDDPEYIPTIEGDTFVEWNTAIDGSGKSYQPGDYVNIMSNYENGSTDVDFYPTLYAVFEKATTKNVVTFVFWEDHTRDGNAMDERIVMTCDENGIVSAVTFPAALTNPLSEFAGWYCYKNGVTYEAGETYTNLDIKELMDEDFYDREGSVFVLFDGRWKEDVVSFEKTATLWLEFEGSFSWLETPVSGTYCFSQDQWTYKNGSIVIPADSEPDNEKEGYTFIGWNTSQYGVGTMYQPGDTFTFTGYPNVTLYATYETANHFTLIETSEEIFHFIKDAEPVMGIVLRDDVNIDDVRMVVAKVDEATQGEVLAAIGNMTEITEINGQPNYEMLDISLIDSQDHGVSIESGKVKIVVAYPDIPNAKDYNYTIYHYKDGTVETVYVEKYENGLVFYADSFSPFTLVWTKDKEDGNASDEPDIPDDTNDYIAVGTDGRKYVLSEIRIHGNDQPLSDEEAAEYISLVGAQPDHAMVFDIRITDSEGNPLTMLPGKSIRVSLPKPSIDQPVAFHLNHINNGQVETVRIKQSTGSLVYFDGTAFSPYVLTWNETNSAGGETPATGDSFTPVPFLVLLFVSAMAAAGIVFYTKYKKSKGKGSAEA